MPKYSKASLKKLETCDPRIKKVFKFVIGHYDNTVLEGERGKERQNSLYAQGKSRVVYPNGKHNKKPSSAIDAVPYPIIWPDKKTGGKNYFASMARFYHFAGFVCGVAMAFGIKLRWGGDWNMNNDFTDNNFNDLPHFEVYEED